MIFETPAKVVKKLWMRMPYMDESREFWSVEVGGHQYHGLRTQNDARFIGQMMATEGGDAY